MKSVPLAAAGREGSKLRTRASSPCDSTAITAHKPPEQESVSIFDSSFILLPDRHGNCRLSVSRRVPTDLRSDVTFLSDGAVNAFGIVEEHLSKTQRRCISSCFSWIVVLVGLADSECAYHDAHALATSSVCDWVPRPGLAQGCMACDLERVLQSFCMQTSGRSRGLTD